MKKMSALYSLFIPFFLIAKELPPALNQNQFEEAIFNWTRSFAEILELTQRKHYKVTNIEECMIKALDNFLNTLDPHSNLLDPKTYKNMLDQTSGEFFGIGVIIDNTRTSKDKFLTVIDTLPDGPADKAGVKPLDKIIEIDGKGLDGMNTDEITSLLKGERNTKVTIKVTRENQPDLVTLEITRDLVKDHHSLSFYIDKYDIYYLSLTMFSETACNQLEQLLKKAHQKKCKGIILDLRNNSGGLLTSAIDIAGLFLPKGSLVVSTKDKNGKETERFHTTRDPITTNETPIFIMINNFTASAAEILAGCLKMNQNNTGKSKNNLVFITGTSSFGKGSVQEVIPIANNCAIKLTISLYFLPDGTSLQGTGITPDFEIERRFPMTEQQKWFMHTYGREQAFTNYIKINPEPEKEKKPDTSKHKNWQERAQSALETDNQLRETIILINILAQAQSSCPSLVSTPIKALKYLQDIFVSSTQPLAMTPVKV